MDSSLVLTGLDHLIYGGLNLWLGLEFTEEYMNQELTSGALTGIIIVVVLLIILPLIMIAVVHLIEYVEPNPLFRNIIFINIASTVKSIILYGCLAYRLLDIKQFIAYSIFLGALLILRSGKLYYFYWKLQMAIREANASTRINIPHPSHPTLETKLSQVVPASTVLMEIKIQM